MHKYIMDKKNREWLNLIDKTDEFGCSKESLVANTKSNKNKYKRRRRTEEQNKRKKKHPLKSGCTSQNKTQIRQSNAQNMFMKTTHQLEHRVNLQHYTSNQREKKVGQDQIKINWKSLSW